MNVLLLLYTYIDGNIGGTNMRIGESFIPGGVTHTLGRNDRGVTPTGESFIPLTPFLSKDICCERQPGVHNNVQQWILKLQCYSSPSFALLR